jgi:hypothetical protein
MFSIAAFGGTGYEKYSINPGLTNADFGKMCSQLLNLPLRNPTTENVFYKEN